MASKVRRPKPPLVTPLWSPVQTSASWIALRSASGRASKANRAAS